MKENNKFPFCLIISFSFCQTICLKDTFNKNILLYKIKTLPLGYIIIYFIWMYYYYYERKRIKQNKQQQNNVKL